MRVLIVVMLFAACADHAKQSVTLYEAGDYAGAARAADEGLASHPEDDGLWAMRVRSALALGDADGVAKAYSAYVAERGHDDKELLRDLSTATIEQGLASPSARLKIIAIQAVERLELQELADAVAQKMGDQDERVIAAAAVAVLHGYRDAPQAADQMLRSENAEARRIAVDGIGKKVGKIAEVELVKAAEDPDPRVRAAALRWLGTLKDPDVVDTCTARMKDSDDGVRAAAASALARIGGPNVAALGKQALADKALGVRLAGVELLAAGHADADLAAAADDKDVMVALAAAMALKQPPLVAKAVQRAATAQAWEARAGVANYLVSALGRADAVPVASRLAADPEVAVRLAAARVLAHAGDREGARRVFAAALSSDHGVQAAADLAELGDAQGLAALSGAVRDAKATPEQRAEAAELHRVAHRVTPGLVAALADSNGLVRVQAAAVLGELAR